MYNYFINSKINFIGKSLATLIARRFFFATVFVIGTEGHFNLYQVCADLSNDDTRKREFRAIKEACNELNCSNAKVIVLNQPSEQIAVDNITIYIFNAVDWLTE